ncbi:hypothetical protein HY994_00540, partial [Candidatus Micrarchaeota archaeon]|nr:hypothetical protein [Candidatus Micrarchaeota archaeon]
MNFPIKSESSSAGKQKAYPVTFNPLCQRCSDKPEKPAVEFTYQTFNPQVQKRVQVMRSCKTDVLLVTRRDAFKDTVQQKTKLTHTLLDYFTQLKKEHLSARLLDLSDSNKKFPMPIKPLVIVRGKKGETGIDISDALTQISDGPRRNVWLSVSTPVTKEPEKKVVGSKTLRLFDLHATINGEKKTLSIRDEFTNGPGGAHTDSTYDLTPLGLSAKLSILRFDPFIATLMPSIETLETEYLEYQKPIFAAVKESSAKYLVLLGGSTVIPVPFIRETESAQWKSSMLKFMSSDGTVPTDWCYAALENGCQARSYTRVAVSRFPSPREGSSELASRFIQNALDARKKVTPKRYLVGGCSFTTDQRAELQRLFKQLSEISSKNRAFVKSGVAQDHGSDWAPFMACLNPGTSDDGSCANGLCSKPEPSESAPDSDSSAIWQKILQIRFTCDTNGLMDPQARSFLGGECSEIGGSFPNFRLRKITELNPGCVKPPQYCTKSESLKNPRQSAVPCPSAASYNSKLASNDVGIINFAVHASGTELFSTLVTPDKMLFYHLVPTVALNGNPLILNGGCFSAAIDKTYQNLPIWPDENVVFNLIRNGARAFIGNSRLGVPSTPRMDDYY